LGFANGGIYDTLDDECSRVRRFNGFRRAAVGANAVYRWSIDIACDDERCAGDAAAGRNGCDAAE
jgi:hypothetical protein